MRLLPVDPSDQGSQRCRMGPALMSALGLSLGSPLLVSFPRGSCLCTAWPRTDLAEGFLQTDLKVSSPSLMSHPPTQLQIDHSKITPVTCSILRCVKTTVIVGSVEFKKRTPSRLIHELVKDMLKGLYVQTTFVVNLEDFDTDIKYVVIEDIKSDSVNGGLITSKTGLEIVGILTARYYNSQLQNRNMVPLGGLEEVCELVQWNYMICAPRRANFSHSFLCFR